MSGLYYWNVHDLVAEFTTSVLHDRLGLGWSDAVELPRTGAQVTDDLRELLRAANVPGPYVLVGHSLGGLHARLYAKRFPAEIAGLVLLDPTHEDIADYLPEQQARRLRNRNPDVPDPPAEQVSAMRSAYRAAFERALADWPRRDPGTAAGPGIRRRGLPAIAAGAEEPAAALRRSPRGRSRARRAADRPVRHGTRSDRRRARTARIAGRRRIRPGQAPALLGPGRGTPPSRDPAAGRRRAFEPHLEPAGRGRARDPGRPGPLT
nr:alpha/beta fold hydrolase [Saccharopolyspora gloriosae]